MNLSAPEPARVDRLVILVSQYHERVTARLLEGARAACRDAGVPEERVDVVQVAGAFELGVAAAAAAVSDRYDGIIALGAVIRGETPHFEYVAGETARVLAEVAAREVIPVGFGLLTTDTMEQAVERAGGSAGNKGREAAEAVLQAIAAVQWLLADDD
ncbi:MAG: 6,7-dimethyl-8-ribityllumazine synthase [Gemmatimonadales bacterium]|nr:6,7-dimethyl-8-ribityllumazine synthase [Gemmatimonadales bacterium]